MKNRTAIVAALLAVVCAVAAWGGNSSGATTGPATDAAAVALPMPRNLLAHGTAGKRWVGVIARPANSLRVRTSAAVDRPDDQTQIYCRTDGPGQHWKPLTMVAGRVTGMAGASSQLAVLLDNGSWATVWADNGSASGQPLPAGGVMRAITDDGTDLWAAGLVDGGLGAVGEEAAQRGKGGTTTAPATGPATAAAATRPAARLVVFHHTPGGWVGVAELPDVRTPGAAAAVSLAVVDGRPVVGYQDEVGGVRVLRPSAGREWDVVADRRPPPGKAFAAFDLIVTDGGPLLWTTVGGNAGDVVRLPTTAPTADGPGTRPAAAAIDLTWPQAVAIDGVAAAAYGGEYLRVFARHADDRTGDDLYEQRYDVSSGRPADPVGRPSSLESGADANRGAVPTWLQVLVLASLTFSFGASVYRYLSANPKDKPTAADAPRPAALGPRFKAGLVDALPMLAAVAAAAVGARGGTWGGGSSLTTVLILLVGAALYVGHTTLLEVATGRSIGKRLFGLKVVRVDGSPATPGQLAGRNLLRVCDPVVVLMISPLGQRSADVAMGTMVVSTGDPAAEPGTGDRGGEDAGRTGDDGA